MFRARQIVRCVVTDATGLMRGRYCTILSMHDGWVTVINDFGFELARAAVALRPDLKVLLTTGFPLARQGRDPAQNLGWPMIGKPYRLRELGRHITDLLPRSGPVTELRPHLASASG